MKNITTECQKFGETKSLDTLSTLQEKIEVHPAVQELKCRYPHYKMSLTDLCEFARTFDCCKKCRSLENCESLVKGHYMVPKESSYSNTLSFAYKRCKIYYLYQQQQKTKRLIQSHFIPDHILNTTFTSMEIDQMRKEAIFAAMHFCDSFQSGKTTSGLYLYGPMGVGKSAIAGAIANELAKRNVEVLMVYVPEFLGEIKAAIQTGEVEEKLKALKEVSVLILDDIGAETLSSWVRDDVLGAILQKRMEKLPTIFTSNLSTRELQEHLARTKGEGNPNHKKAARIMERIEPFVNSIKVNGINRRRNGR